MQSSTPDLTTETVDPLVGDWSIIQLAKGHRFSVDDQLTAWLASRAQPSAQRMLDLGAGIGSVGLTALYHQPGAHLTMVEAQELSHRLARRTIAMNNLGSRVTPLLGDLRSATPSGPFDLITGSPPYIPVGKGHISPHPQRAHARIELRGDVFDYCRAAARALASNGAFVFCHAWNDPRPFEAIRAVGLHLGQHIDVYFRVGRDPTISLFAASWTPGPTQKSAITIRNASGDHSEQYRQIRREVSAPSNPKR